MICIVHKRNTTDLVLHNPFGGFAPGEERCLRMLSKRSIGTTVYENWAAADYCTYWGQRISGSIVIVAASGGARRFARQLAGRPLARGAAPHAPACRASSWPPLSKRPARSAHAARSRAS